MRAARFVAAALAALPVAVSAAPPAHAEVVAGGGTVTASRCSGLHCWSGVVTTDMKPLGGSGTVLVTWNCQAAGSIDPLLTSVATCSVGGHDAPSVTLPGPYAASAGVAIFTAGADVLACVSGHGVFAENLLGDQYVDAGECKRLQIVRVPL